MDYSEIAAIYRKLRRKWDDRESNFPYYEFPDDFGREHLEISPDGKMAIVARERGQETSRRETYDLDELLFWMFAQASHARGFQFEFENRDPNLQDPRHIAFPHALEEIGKISPKWRIRLQEKQDKILNKNPLIL